MSLFLRIFLSFWLVAALLAASFFALGRLSSDKAVDKAQARLKAQAVLVAGIWLQGGHRHTMHWLFQQNNKNRPLLVNASGVSPFSMINMGMTPAEIGMMQHNMTMGETELNLKYPLVSGIQYQNSGQLSLIEMLPDVKPALFLVEQLEAEQLRRIPFSVWLLITFLTISLISFLLARTLTKRLYQLRYATQKLAEGDLASRVKIQGRDEVSALADDFNRMAGQLQSMLKSQRQLVSDVSHELRSPLARLRIALELAERIETPKTMLPRIEKEADELENLVTDLLSLARIESAQFTLEMKHFCLCELLHKIVEDANFEGARQNKKVVLQACDETIIHADPVLMRSAIENIIRNALRYTPVESEVEVSVKKALNKLTISIKDQGIGVPDDALQKLFEPFARISEARDRKTGGFGLGLAITGRVIKAHGGKVFAKNRAKAGLSIYIYFPLS